MGKTVRPGTLKLLKNTNCILRIIVLFIIVATFSSCRIISDSKLTLEQSLAGTKAPKVVSDSMILLDVKYYSFDKKLHKGQIVINTLLKKDVKKLFSEARKIKFPINKVIPIVKYHWNDDSSMTDNNTSSFNYRLVARTNRPSNHSWGRAIDINPFTNPAVHPDGLIEPVGAKYDSEASGALNLENKIMKLMLSLGWEWGGGANWLKIKGYQDYQHIQKLK
ncbi:MAG: M15 family metallopeptidase [Bacteroidota bacterium]